MLYTRSSFINYLKKVHDCTITPISTGNSSILQIQHGPAKAYIMVKGKDRIDYEEIYIVCRKLWLSDMPGDKDLVKIE